LCFADITKNNHVDLFTAIVVGFPLAAAAGLNRHALMKIGRRAKAKREADKKVPRFPHT
jgi:hypothetical protein